MYYIFGAIVLAPLLYFTRRWSMPIILYAIEYSIYLGLMHVALFVVVYLTSNFRDASSMDRAFSRTTAKTGWGTPILEFWNLEAYNPKGLFWFEIILAVVIFLLMWRYRPMKTGTTRRQKQKAAVKKAAAAKMKSIKTAGRPDYRND